MRATATRSLQMAAEDDDHDPWARVLEWLKVSNLSCLVVLRNTASWQYRSDTRRNWAKRVYRAGLAERNTVRGLGVGAAQIIDVFFPQVKP